MDACDETGCRIECCGRAVWAFQLVAGVNGALAGLSIALLKEDAESINPRLSSGVLLFLLAALCTEVISKSGP